MRAARQAQARQALEQDRQRRRHFEPRQRRADAEVDSRPERQMRVGIAPRIERVRIGKALGIAIGRPEQEADPLAFAQADPRDFDVLERIAGEEMQRRVEAQKLLDRRRRRLAVGEDRPRVEPAFEDQP